MPVFPRELLHECPEGCQELEQLLLQKMREALLEASLQPLHAGKKLVFNCSRHDQRWDFYVEDSCATVGHPIADMMEFLEQIFDYALLPNIQLEAVNGVITLEEPF